MPPARVWGIRADLSAPSDSSHSIMPSRYSASQRSDVLRARFLMRVAPGHLRPTRPVADNPGQAGGPKVKRLLESSIHHARATPRLKGLLVVEAVALSGNLEALLGRVEDVRDLLDEAVLLLLELRVLVDRLLDEQLDVA